MRPIAPFTKYSSVYPARVKSLARFPFSFALDMHLSYLHRTESAPSHLCCLFDLIAPPCVSGYLGYFAFRISPFSAWFQSFLCTRALAFVLSIGLLSNFVILGQSVRCSSVWSVHNLHHGTKHCPMSHFICNTLGRSTSGFNHHLQHEVKYLIV